MPLRLPGAAVKAAVRSRWGGPKRPSWNAAIESAITSLRSAAKNYPRDIGLLRLATTGNIPGPLLPEGCLRCSEVGDDGLKLEWIWPASLTPDLAAARFSASSRVDDASFCGSEGFSALVAE